MASIHKRENKGRTTYQIKYRVNDKMRSKTVPTAKMAREFKSRIEHELHEGIYIDNTNIKMNDYLDQWLNIHGQKIRATTLEGYKDRVKVIKRYIGHIPLQKILATDIESMYTNYGRDRSERSVYSLHQILRIAFKYAFKSRIIKSNTMDIVDPPPHGKASVDTIQYAKLEKYLDCVKDCWVYPAVVMATFLGMRREEIFALDWNHVDFKKNEIYIEFVHNIIEKQLDIAPPKNDEERTIPMPDDISAMLKKHRQEQRKRRIQLGKLYHIKCNYTGNANNYVLTLDDGKRPKPQSITQMFKRRQSIAGLPVVSFHSLKHTAATLMDLAGVNPKITSEILAHKSIKFTDDVYKYIFDEQMEQARTLLNDKILNNFDL